MAVDLYHKVLAKLFEVTGGKDSQSVDLKELVKNQGFLGSYPSIFQFLSIQGWIMETPKADYVKITHWGVKEAKKSQSGEPDREQNIRDEAKKIVRQTKELVISVDEFAANLSIGNIIQVEKKLEEIKAAVNILKVKI